LVELLLTLVLILCLAAATVFSYTAMHRTANLDEGASRLQSLIRFAQAESATSGRKVRLQFETGARPVKENESEAGSDLRQIKVTWESDFINAPGVFQDYTNKAWSEDMVNELVGVAKVQPIQAPARQSQMPQVPVLDSTVPMPDETTSQNMGGNASNQESLASESQSDGFPSITFYPDGSCDSAEIVLASKNSEDDRRLAVRLSGILGSISSHPVKPENIDDFDDWDSADDSSSTEPVESSQTDRDFAQAE